MTDSDQHSELRELLELYCENRLSQGQLTRLEELARADAASMQLYLDYIELHGNLTWDLAGQPVSLVEPVAIPPKSVSSRQSRRRPAVIAVTTACLAVAAIVTLVRSAGTDENTGPSIAGTKVVEPNNGDAPKPNRSVKPLDLDLAATEPGDEPDALVQEPDPPADVRFTAALGSDAIVSEIDRLLSESWSEAGVTPSPSASPDAITRRLYLDLIGRIPTTEELQLAQQSRSRSAFANQLLSDTGYARFWSANWANLLIGRSSERGVNRPEFEKFLRDRFAANSPWNETVAELISAEGTTDDNGATNFLVAHLNSQAVPATAVTARVFLGIQVQCTECHDHPFNKTWKQDQFWTFNSFFKQTKRERQQTGPNQRRFLLTSTRESGPTYYETRSGLMKSALPEFAGIEIDPAENRRAALADIVTRKDNVQLARSMVNRVWAHFFGYGFTRPVDDMGPHNPPSHPELLDVLAHQFRLHNFDLHKLITWIIRCRAYALDSAFAGNDIDAPSRGEVPLFSRMYVRSMSPEQVYDSLLIATRADQKPGFEWETANQRRHEWIQQFLFAHANEENSEASTFDGTVSQAMSLMNGELVKDAVSTERGTLLASITEERNSAAEQLTAICRAVLSRDPSEAEVNMFKSLFRRERTAAGRKTLLQDALWAYLNSNEFILIH